MSNVELTTAMTMGSLFDGIGGFPLAAARFGINTVWASEIEAFPIEVTLRRFPSMAHKGDITKLSGKLLFPVDIICGGSPCQDLSVAGARAGLSGARSGLFMEQIRISKDVLHSCKVSGEIRKLVKGLMIESYIEDGAQKVGDGCYGKSITDPCLGWEKTEKLIYELAELW